MDPTGSHVLRLGLTQPLNLSVTYRQLGRLPLNYTLAYRQYGHLPLTWPMFVPKSTCPLTPMHFIRGRIMAFNNTKHTFQFHPFNHVFTHLYLISIFNPHTHPNPIHPNPKTFPHYFRNQISPNLMHSLVEQRFNITHIKISSHIRPKKSLEHQRKIHSKRLLSIQTGHIFQRKIGEG